MSYSIYVIDLEIEKRYKVEDRNIKKLSDVSIWLREKGKTEYIYELWKGLQLHSRWKFKEKTNRWGRMSTPKKS